MTTTLYRRAYVSTSGWYSWRNSLMYDQAQTMSIPEIADYWRLAEDTIKKILDAEIERRND